MLLPIKCPFCNQLTKIEYYNNSDHNDEGYCKSCCKCYNYEAMLFSNKEINQAIIIESFVLEISGNNIHVVNRLERDYSIRCNIFFWKKNFGPVSRSTRLPPEESINKINDLLLFT